MGTRRSVDPKVPLAEQIGTLAALREKGKIRHVGLSNADREQVRAAAEIVPIASVQNQYNVENRQSEPVLEYCEAHGMAFIPYFPLGGGEIGVDRTAALRWLLQRSDAMLPIPGTSSLQHLQENMQAIQELR